MKILLLANGAWYSFISQARGLQAALRAVHIDAEVMFSAEHIPNLDAYKDHLVIPIGSWQQYDSIVAPALDAGCKTLPWFVSDGSVAPEIAAKLNQLPRLLTTSEYCKRIFTRDGVDEERLRIIYECVDETVWKPAAADELERFLSLLSIDEPDRTNLPLTYNLHRAKQNHIPILCTIGGDVGSKGGVEILQALSSLPTDLPWIYIIKTMPLDPDHDSIRQIEQAVIDASHGMSSKIKYISGEFSTSFMTGLMNVSDVYIATSRGEGFGLPLVEAQMCGKMVITHRANSTPETIVEGKTGLLAECHVDDKGIARADIPDLARILQDVLSDQSKREALSAAARDTAIARFGTHAIGQQFAQAIKDFVA